MPVPASAPHAVTLRDELSWEKDLAHAARKGQGEKDGLIDKLRDQLREAVKTHEQDVYILNEEWKTKLDDAEHRCSVWTTSLLFSEVAELAVVPHTVEAAHLCEGMCLVRAFVVLLAFTANHARVR